MEIMMKEREKRKTHGKERNLKEGFSIQNNRKNSRANEDIDIEKTMIFLKNIVCRYIYTIFELFNVDFQPRTKICLNELQ